MSESVGFTTKLWLLQGKFDYDCAWGFVVRSETESEARQIAQDGGGDEVRSGKTPWIDPSITTCIELTADGEPGVVLEDFHAG